MNEFKAFITGIIIGLFAIVVWLFGRYFYRRSVRGTQSNSRSSTEGTGKAEEVRGRLEETSTNVQDDFRGLDESHARATELLQKANNILDSGKRSNNNS